MKYSILAISLICSINFMIAQETIDVKFNEAVPIWVHTMVDTTFVPVPGQPYFTKYSSVYPHIAHKEGDFLYVMGECLEKQSLYDHGFILDKIDMKTGQKLWSHFNTPYNGGHKDIYHVMKVKENKIELVGAMEDSDRRIYATYKTLDNSTGELLGFRKSTYELPNIYYTRAFVGHVLHSDSILLHAYTRGIDMGGTWDDPIYNYYLKTVVYDREMNI